MKPSLSDRWAETVLKRRAWILLGWLMLAISIRSVAPSWNEVAFDGDFEYLPAEMSSVAGGHLLDAAFPEVRSRSQIVLVLGRDEEQLTKQDEIVSFDLLRRIHHRYGEVCWKRAIDLGYDGGPTEKTQAGNWAALAKESFDRAIDADDNFYARVEGLLSDDLPNPIEPRMAIAYYDRGSLLESIGNAEDMVGSDFEAALVLFPDLPKVTPRIEDRDLSVWEPLLELVSYDDSLIGTSLSHPNARLLVLQLSSELAATGNIAMIEAMEQMLDDIRNYSMQHTSPGLQLRMTGSAAIGGETLLASRDAIRYTEWITVAMILLILSVVYRAPLLVAVPMISIAFAVIISTSLVTLLTQWSIAEIIPGLDLRIFTTSRIFVVVILFGAGTDYCLFLIARLREEAMRMPWRDACQISLREVMGALTGSALTTVVGLGMLWIASYGKFHYTGPIIAICLLIGLLVCTTLTPALIFTIGPKVFWPANVSPDAAQPRIGFFQSPSSAVSPANGFWSWIALTLTRHPITTLSVGMSLLFIPAWHGIQNEQNVTYDLSSQLDEDSECRQGLALLSKHFDIGKINPVTILMLRPSATTSEAFEQEIRELGDSLYSVEGVATVRSADDPLGDFPPDRNMSLLSKDAWRRRALRSHRISQRHFFSTTSTYKNRLARLDVTIDGDPFSEETVTIVNRLRDHLDQLSTMPSSAWNGANVLLTGTTPSIIDLRTVTLQDNQRIKLAVIVAVFAILMVVIKRLELCLYLIATVLISYYATLGLTLLFFESLYGGNFVGLDWKLPLFLFVILVAVGQDYNVYLVTRIVEEQRRLGWLSALRRAITRTGGIITACGLVMAATFLSMTSSAWLPSLLDLLSISHDSSGRTLKGITELGFALGLGVLIDTFYVRTILVPSFVAMRGSRMTG
ncbi:MAG: MMPL family transporter [Rubripirellula sp.]|nr:MMPL family transporter [Rubripirellula sp.]